MKLLVSLLALLFYISGFGQNVEADSLKQQLLTVTDDSKKVYILESLSYAYLSSHPDTALQYALQGLELAKNNDFKKGEAICTNALGNVYFHIGDNAKALKFYLEYLQLKEGFKEKENIGVAYFNMASVYTEEKEYRTALYYLLKARSEDEKAKDTSGMLYDSYSVGSVYLRMNLPDSALIYLNQCYRFATQLNDGNMLGAILNTFGEAYFLMSDFKKAAYYYNRSIPYASVVNDNEVLTSNLYGKAKIFSKKNQPDSAIFYGRRALHIAQEAPFLKQVLEISTFLSDAFSKTKQYDSAFTYQNLSIATKDSLFNVDQLKKVQNLQIQEQARQQLIEIDKIKYRNRVRLYAVAFAGIIILGVAIILWRLNKQKQSANQLLKKQKRTIETTLNQLKSAQSQLIHTEKMASLGELTAGIAHEIQNPLNFVNNFSEINNELIKELKTERAAPPGVRKESEEDEILNDISGNLEKISYHGKRAEAIVKAMLQHSRVNSGSKELTDINALADEYLRLSYHGFRAKDKSFNAEIKTSFDPSLQPINVVSQDIGRVLLNLFNNAFYAASQPSGVGLIKGTPTVFVSTSHIPPLEDKGAGILISVKDNGPGIPQNVFDKIFQPFFTTKPTGQGTGLGLSLSYDIIKAHGGDITVQTTEGEGTEFIIEIPA